MDITFGEFSRYILILTAGIATLYYKKYKQTPLRYIMYYLWYAALLEVVASNMWQLFKISNAWWYNIGINIEILFYLYLYYQYIVNKRIKNFILIGGLIYESYFLINYLVLSDNWNVYQYFPFTLGSLLIIVVVFMFLLEMFQSDKVLYSGRYLIFWISLGLLLYNIIPLPLFVARSFITNSISIMNIQFTGNILMYFSFIYGFIWSSMKYKL